MTPLPRYSGQARRAASSTCTKPGGPARNVQSHSPSRVGGRDEHHLLAADELPHPLVEVVEHLLVVEPLGPLGRVEPVLQGPLPVVPCR